MPSLPFDLERMIFELAVLEDKDHDNRIRITLVAKRVCEWVRPILYRVAIAEGVSTLTIRNWRKAQRTDVARFVRHLLTIGVQESHILELLSTFRMVENLAIWGCLSISSEILRQISDLPLRAFSANLDKINLEEAIENCGAFRNLTHLDVISLEGPTLKDCNALVKLPKLTHLCFDYSAKAEEKAVLTLLESCSSLQVLIYLYPSELAIADIRIVPRDLDDPRYLAIRDDLPDDAKDWERSANGQTGLWGLWEHADKITEARRAALFRDNKSSCILSRTTWKNGLNDNGIRWYEEWLAAKTS